MQSYGLVSIITPNWNCGRFIAETIESVLAQTYTEWELLIQDDCSTDNSMEVVWEYAKRDARIKIEVNPKNLGAAITRNHALARAKGRWIAFLDSDDLWTSDKLEHQLKFMVVRKVAFTYHEYTEIDEQSNGLGVHVSGKAHVGKWGMFACCWPGCLSVMYDAKKVGLIQIRDIKNNNDSAMWLKVICKADCYLLKEQLARYRRRKGSITPPGIWARIRWHYVLFREAEQMNPVAAALWMCINVVGNSYKKIFFVKRL